MKWLHKYIYEASGFNYSNYFSGEKKNWNSYAIIKWNCNISKSLQFLAKFIEYVSQIKFVWNVHIKKILLSSSRSKTDHSFNGERNMKKVQRKKI